MSSTLNLSETAVAVLRFRAKGYPMPVTPERLPAFEELVAAGIMESSGEDFRFTPEGWERREEILDAQTDRIQRERYAPPDSDLALSRRARRLLRTCITEIPEGNRLNRPAFRELVKARIMMPMGSFTKGDECVFLWTYWGWRLRFELAGVACSENETG